jgi:hypothetical protein
VSVRGKSPRDWQTSVAPHQIKMLPYLMFDLVTMSVEPTKFVAAQPDVSQRRAVSVPRCADLSRSNASGGDAGPNRGVDSDDGSSSSPSAGR